MIFLKFKRSATIFILWVVLVKESTSNDSSINDDYIYSDTYYRNEFNEDNISKNENMLNESTSVQIEIKPDSKEYVLESNSTSKDHTFNCSGNQIVKWYFEQYNGRLIRKKNKSVYNKVSKRFVTMFSLSRGAYLDTGFYYCAPLGLEEKSIKQYKKIFVYVQHETHLLAIPNEYEIKCQASDNGKVIIPIKTTSPDINVKLISKSANFPEIHHYDEKIGFTIDKSCSELNNVRFICAAQKNSSNISENRTILLYNESTEIYPDLPKYILLSNSTNNHKVFTCKGLRPVQWYYEQYDGNLLTAKSEKTYDDKLSMYVAVLTLNKGSNLDTGYYYCAHWSEKNACKQSNKTYIFVQYKENLLAIPNDNNIIWNDSNENEIILPCRPTSPDIHVKLFLGDLNLTDTVHYDQHIGFVLEEFKPYINYTCIAQRNNKSEVQIVNLRITNLEISPDVSEYIFTSYSTEYDHMFTCTGNEPVQWYFEQYDGTLLTKNSHSISVFSKVSDTYEYLTSFSLNKTTYLDTGYYYCAPLAAESRLIKSFKKIYIFVKHEIYLFAIPDGFTNKWISIDNDDNAIIIPCRPTSPDINVKICIEKNEIDIDGSSEINYDAKIGFVVNRHDQLKRSNFTCVAQRNNISAKQIFIDRIENYLTIHNEYSDYVISGQNVTLKCSLTPLSESLDSNLTWIVSENMENQSERIRTDQKRRFFYESGSILLNIRNVTTKDGGYYTCKISINNYGLISVYNISYELKVISSNKPHINLKILNDTNSITLPVGYHSVQWNVQVSANPNAIIEWRDPEGNKIETIVDKKSVKNYDQSSQLIIRDLEVYDSGVYKLIAYNNAEKNEINVTLLVEEKPIIISINHSKTKNLYCKLGTICSFEFHVSGYPLPEVEWTNFKNNMSSVYKQYNTQINWNKTQISPVTLKYFMSLNVTENLTFICNATNKFGKSNKEFTILVADEFNGFDIEGPSIIVDGDNVIIICSASKYSYLNDIIWTYPLINFDKNKIHVIENKTENSHRSYFIIENISPHLNGTISCTVNRKTESKEVSETETKSFALKVEDHDTPMIVKSLSNSVTLILTKKPIEMWCNVSGIPLPTVTWFKDNQQLLVNDSRILLINLNQTLLIQKPESEDEGIYKCNATNRFGSVTSTYYLSEDTRMVDLLFCCVLTVFLAIVMNGSILWIILERKLKKKIKVNRKKEFEKGIVKSWNRYLGVEEQPYLIPYDNRWEFPMDKIELGEQIGLGAYGIVYKAKATGLIDDNTTTTVAIKTVRPSADPCHAMALASELKIMINLGRHLNIVNVLGACTTNTIKRLMVIVEYCCFGSIDQYMQKHRDDFINQITPDGFIDSDIECLPNVCDDYSVLNTVEHEKDVSHHMDQKNINRKTLCTNDLLSWSYQVSKGMEFLTSKNILHGDLASRNILLAEQNIVKICDFGLAKNMYKRNVYKKPLKKTALPIKWMAVESLRYGIFSTASDVWSFGIVLWEIFSLAAVPYPNIQLDDLLNKLIQGYRMEQPIYGNSIIYGIILDCWKMEPTERPSFSDLVVRVGDLLQECSKSNYVELISHYMKTYSERFPSTDIMHFSAAPTVLNNSLVAPESCTESTRKYSEHHVSNENIEMNTIVAHNASD